MVANGFEGVPWMIGGGAKHSANAGRLLAYAALGGQEGVITPGDLKVSATPGTADAKVHIATGAAGILNRSAGAFSEMYIGRAPLVSDVDIASTGSSGRSDLIVARIEDQEYPPWSTAKYTDPAQIENGPYIFPRVISGVSNTITRASQLGGIYANHSMIAVARIDIPANKTAITSDMIKDLRRLARPRSWNTFDVQQGPGSTEFLAVTDTNWKNFPSNAFSVEVPDWATWAQVSVELRNVLADGSGDIDFRVNLDGLTGAVNHFDYNAPAGTPTNWTEGVPMAVFAEFDVTSKQGKTVVIRPQGMRVWTDNAGALYTRATEQVIFDVRFQERVV